MLEPCHCITKVPGPRTECFGYRICGDNIDKAVKARYLTYDRHNKSLHYFQSYAVLNHIHASNFSEATLDLRHLDMEVVTSTLLPTPSNDRALKKNMTTLICRVLVENIDCFKFGFEDAVEWHIKHYFYGEMSVVVSFHSIANIMLHL